MIIFKKEVDTDLYYQMLAVQGILRRLNDVHSKVEDLPEEIKSKDDYSTMTKDIDTAQESLKSLEATLHKLYCQATTWPFQ